MSESMRKIGKLHPTCQEVTDFGDLVLGVRRFMCGRDCPADIRQQHNRDYGVSDASAPGWKINYHICRNCGSDRWVGVRPGGPDAPRFAQCVPCGTVGDRIEPDEEPRPGREWKIDDYPEQSKCTHDGPSCRRCATDLDAAGVTVEVDGLRWSAYKDDWTNGVLFNAPESWDGDSGASSIALSYVATLEARMDAAGISREKWVEP